MMSDIRLICVTGPDGSGKTTQIAKLAERLERRGKLKTVAVTIWDLLLDPSTKDRVAFRTPAQVDAYLRLLHPTARAMFLYHCFFQALEQARKRSPDLCLINAYWYKYYATEVAHGGDPETLRRLADVFPQPDQVFVLQVEPEEAYRRKAEVSGYESGFAEPRTREAFIEFQSRAQRAFNGLIQETWVRLDGREPVDALAESILRKIPEEVVC